MEPLIKFSTPVNWVLMAVVEGGSRQRYATKEDLYAAGWLPKTDGEFALEHGNKIDEILGLPCRGDTLWNETVAAVEKLKADRDALKLAQANWPQTKASIENGWQRALQAERKRAESAEADRDAALLRIQELEREVGQELAADLELRAKLTSSELRIQELERDVSDICGSDRVGLAKAIDEKNAYVARYDALLAASVDAALGDESCECKGACTLTDGKGRFAICACFKQMRIARDVRKERDELRAKLEQAKSELLEAEDSAQSNGGKLADTVSKWNRAEKRAEAAEGALRKAQSVVSAAIEYCTTITTPTRLKAAVAKYRYPESREDPSANPLHPESEIFPVPVKVPNS